MEDSICAKKKRLKKLNNKNSIRAKRERKKLRGKKSTSLQIGITCCNVRSDAKIISLIFERYFGYMLWRALTILV